MKFTKLASVSVKKEILNNVPVYCIYGNTYPIRDTLKRELGVIWHGVKKCWFVRQDKFDQNFDKNIAVLQRLHINVQDLQGGPRNQPIDIPQETKKETLEGVEYPTKIEGEEKTRNRYSFPIRKNILVFPVEFTIDGEQYTENVYVNRFYKKGETSDYYKVTFNKEYKDYPVYQFEIGKKEFDESPIVSLTFGTKKSNKAWGTYDEKKFLLEECKPLIENKLKNSSLQVFQFEYNYRKRDDDFKNYLKSLPNILNTKTKEGIYKVNLNTPLYQGKFDIALSYNSLGEYTKVDSIRVYPFVDHPQASDNYRHQLCEIPLFSIFTKDQLFDEINKKLNENEVKEKYIKYLESFPYTKAENKEGYEEFLKIIEFIKNPESHIEEVSDILQEMGYIRPNLRSTGKMMPDSKKILNDIYNHQNKEHLNYFFTLIGYVLHYYYKGHDLRSWSMQQMFDVYYIVQVLSKYDNIDKAKVVNAVVKFGDLCYNKFFGEKHKNRWDNYNDFYGGKRNQGRQEPQINKGGGNAIDDLKALAEENGIDTSTNIKSIYRALSRRFHPDVNKEEGAEEMMKLINNIWDRIPEEKKQAFNLKYYRTVYATS